METTATQSNETVTYPTTEELKQHFGYHSTNQNRVMGMAISGELVGIVEYHYFTNNQFRIEEIQVYGNHKGKSYSNLLLQKLVERYPRARRFTGFSTMEAISYWEHKGATFDAVAYESYLSGEWEKEVDEGDEFLIPFTLGIGIEK